MAERFADWWREYTAVDEELDHITPEQRAAVTAPYGLEWPGLAPAATVTSVGSDHGSWRSGSSP